MQFGLKDDACAHFKERIQTRLNEMIFEDDIFLELMVVDNATVLVR